MDHGVYYFFAFTRVIFGSSVGLSIWRWTYVPYCRSAMAQKLFSTDPGKR